MGLVTVFLSYSVYLHHLIILILMLISVRTELLRKVILLLNSTIDLSDDFVVGCRFGGNADFMFFLEMKINRWIG